MKKMKTTLLLTSIALVAARAENRSIYHPDDFTLARKDVEIARRAAAKADQSQPMHTNGSDEQMFGANKQIPRGGRSD